MPTIPDCFACLDVAPVRRFKYQGKKWLEENVSDMLQEIVGAEKAREYEELAAQGLAKPVGICNCCLSRMKQCFDFIYTMRDSVQLLKDLADEYKKNCPAPTAKKKKRKRKRVNFTYKPVKPKIQATAHAVLTSPPQTVIETVQQQPSPETDPSKSDDSGKKRKKKLSYSRVWTITSNAYWVKPEDPSLSQNEASVRQDHKYSVEHVGSVSTTVNSKKGTIGTTCSINNPPPTTGRKASNQNIHTKDMSTDLLSRYQTILTGNNTDTNAIPSVAPLAGRKRSRGLPKASPGAAKKKRNRPRKKLCVRANVANCTGDKTLCNPAKNVSIPGEKSGGNPAKVVTLTRDKPLCNLAKVVSITRDELLYNPASFGSITGEKTIHSPTKVVSKTRNKTLCNPAKVVPFAGDRKLHNPAKAVSKTGDTTLCNSAKVVPVNRDDFLCNPDKYITGDSVSNPVKVVSVTKSLCNPVKVVTNTGNMSLCNPAKVVTGTGDMPLCNPAKVVPIPREKSLHQLTYM